MTEAVGVTLPVEDGLTAAEYVELAQLAERSGNDAVLAGEVAGPEVFSLLGMIAARTSSIRIGSGIVGWIPRGIGCRLDREPYPPAGVCQCARCSCASRP